MAGNKFSPSKCEEKKNSESLVDIEDRHFLFSCMKVTTLDKFSIFFAEVIGTGLLLFIGCAGCVSWDVAPPSIYPCLTFGLAVMLIIQTFGSVSGAHLNPAVTVAAVVYRVISVKICILYILAQVIGSFLGFGLLKLLTPPNIFRPEKSTGAGVCSTVPHEDMSIMQTFALEFFATMGLIFVCCGVWDPRNSKNTDSVAIKFGLTVAVLSLGFGPYTGCSMNPARTLGPAIWNGDFEMHWVYWVAPLMSAVLTTLLYRALFWRDSPKTEADEIALSFVQSTSKSTS